MSWETFVSITLALHSLMLAFLVWCCWASHQAIKILNINTRLMRDVLNALSRDMAIVKADISELKVDVAELKKDVGELKKDVGELKKDVGELKVDMKGVKQRLTSLDAIV